MTENNKRLNLDDREFILIGILRRQPLKRIAAHLNRHVTSISNEFKNHRIFVLK